MARTRQKKRVITTTQPKELDQVIEDEAAENLQPNQISETPEPDLEPTPPKKVRITRKTATANTTKEPRTTRAATKRTASRANLAKSESVPTPPPPPPPPSVQLPRSVSTIPTLIVTEDLTDDSLLDETQPLIKISRLSKSCTENLGKKIVSPVRPISEKDEITSPKATPQQSDSSCESPSNMSTEQVRDYMSPNDAFSSTTMYATLGATMSPQILKGGLDDSSNQLTQRASSSYFNRNIHSKSIIYPASPSINQANFGVTYYFIKSGEGEENPELMEKAYYCMVSRGYNTVWLTESDVADFGPEEHESGNFFFVLPKFTGKLFETLSNHPGWKVTSPIAILNFHSRQFPGRDYPTMDVSMERCFVTVSGFPREVRKILEEKMRCMSGQISSSLKTRTTHIVASSWNTDKCMFTRTHGYPVVMSPDWVEYCWENMREENIDAQDISNSRAFRLPIFTGFVISGASLSRRGQERLCNLVMEHGGVYENFIDSFRTTHLVIVKQEGHHYDRALANERIKIVSPDWIHESISRGYPLPEQDNSMRKFMNRMVGTMMNIVGVPFTSFTDSLARIGRSSTYLENDVQVPGSPEPPEEDIDDEMGSDEEPHELA